MSARQGQKESLCAFDWEKLFMFHSVLCGCYFVGRFCGNISFMLIWFVASLSLACCIYIGDTSVC